MQKNYYIADYLPLLLVIFIVSLLPIKDVIGQTTSTCNCKEYLYLNEPAVGAVLKFEVDPSTIALTQIPNANGEFPWYPGTTGISELPSPHGAAFDLNGNLYIGSDFRLNAPIRKFSCDGTIQPIDATTIYNESILTNIFTIGNTLYATRGGGPIAYDACTGATLGTMCLNDEDGNRLVVPNTTGINVFWGLSYNETTEMVYVTATSSPYQGIWSFTKDQLESGITGTTCADQLVSNENATSDYAGLTVNDAFLPTGINTLTGITSDNDGNIYVTGWFTGNQGFLIKYSPTGRVLAKSVIDPSFQRSRGIVWSEETNQIYMANQTDIATVDCISVFDASDLTYNGTAAPNPNLPQDNSGKALSIVRECCPSPAVQEIDFLYCESNNGTPIFINDIFPCDGAICSAPWLQEPGSTGIAYDECSQSVTVTSDMACGTFTKQSDGNGVYSACGAFSLTFNIEVLMAPNITVSPDQFICSTETPSPLTVTTSATEFRWQMSTVSCTEGFVDIPNAMDATYTPTNVGTTAYYRVVATTEGMCSSGTCEFESPCITVTITDCDFPFFPPTIFPCVDFDPCHQISTDLYLGTQSTADMPTTGTSDDNDGVIFPNDLQPGGTINLPITIFNNTMNDAYLTGWIDWNGDGDFDDAGEQVANETYIYASNNGSFIDYLEVMIPTDANQDGDITTLFRLSTEAAAITDACSETGVCAIDGEVEVYQIQIECKSEICVPPAISINKE